MRKVFIVALVLGVLLAAAPALAITNGVPDGDDHPQVGQLLFYVPDAIDSRFDDPGSWFNCTGTLLSPTVVLTAGHCTYGVGLEGVATSTSDGTFDGSGNDVWVNFSEVPEYIDLPPSGDYIPDRNQTRYDDREVWLDAHPDWIRGTATPHPEYNDFAFFLHDAGIVILTEPVYLPDGYDFGQLPSLGYLDEFLSKKGPNQRFTPVGYGLREIRPFLEFGDTRYTASVKLIDGKGVFGLPEGVSVKFSNNQGKNARGGTCFGDSGGPTFDEGTNIIVAVTSFGINNNCKGTGGGYRIDQQDDLNFIYSFLP